MDVDDGARRHANLIIRYDVIISAILSVVMRVSVEPFPNVEIQVLLLPVMSMVA